MSPKLLNVLLILIPVAFYYGYIDPMYNGTPGLVWTPQKSISVLKSENVQYTNALNQVSFLEEEIKKIDKNYKAVDGGVIASSTILLPDSLDPYNIRNEVTSIANKAGVAIVGVNVIPSNKIKSPKIGTYTVSFTLIARYPVFKKLMEEYEKSMRLFLIDSVMISRVEEKKGEEKTSVITDKEALNISVTFNVPYLLK